MMTNTAAILSYAPVLIKLLQEVVYFDDPQWDSLLIHQTAIRDYFSQIGLTLYVNDEEGFAFLRQPEAVDEAGQAIVLPRLTRRYRLSYEVTLLLVLLRERLDQFDASNPESDRLLLDSDQLWEMVQPFLPLRANEPNLRKKIAAATNKLIDDFGFLKEIKGEPVRYELRRVIKARIDSDKLTEIKEKLRAYADAELGTNDGS